MNDKDLSKDLKNKAIALGLCRQWQREWTTDDKDKLCSMYIEGLDFCVANNYPSVTYMKDNFEGVMQKHGIYVDDRIDIYSPKLRTYIINGSSTGNIVLDDFDLCEIYVRHNANINIISKGQSSVYVSVFDNSNVSIFKESHLSRVHVYKYSDESVLDCKGEDISIKEGKIE